MLHGAYLNATRCYFSRSFLCYHQILACCVNRSVYRNESISDLVPENESFRIFRKVCQCEGQGWICSKLIFKWLAWYQTSIGACYYHSFNARISTFYVYVLFFYRGISSIVVSDRYRWVWYIPFDIMTIRLYGFNDWLSFPHANMWCYVSYYWWTHRWHLRKIWMSAYLRTYPLLSLREGLFSCLIINKSRLSASWLYRRAFVCIFLLFFLLQLYIAIYTYTTYAS